ncbi:hypothetical protein C4559_02835 [Candidatus Microgenomates bacterium]|nr:MAG: hypothetical protein C4559_02835 [Candidatus Microgenomates bacterium]
MPAKRTVKKTIKKSEPEEVTQKTIESFKRNPKKKVIILVAIIIIAVLLLFLKNLFVVAFVNGQPITRIAVIKELEKQSGKQVLESMVTKTLILQEAKKQNVSISKSEVDAEMQKIEKSFKDQGQELDQVLAMRGMTKNDLTEQITIQKTVEKMLSKDINVSDKEVNDYIEKNKITIPETANVAEEKQKIKDQLKQQKLSEKFKSWLENAQKNAKITYFINY